MQHARSRSLKPFRVAGGSLAVPSSGVRRRTPAAKVAAASLCACVSLCGIAQAQIDHEDVHQLSETDAHYLRAQLGDVGCVRRPPARYLQRNRERERRWGSAD